MEIPPKETTSFPTILPSTVHDETVLPQETTLLPSATEPTSQKWPEIVFDYLLIEDGMPTLENGSDELAVIESSAETYGLASVEYVRFFTKCAGSRKSYEDGVFWVCTDEVEYNSGNHYDCYVLENGKIKKLHNQKFEKIFSVMGKEIPIELEYVLHGEKVYVTYSPSAVNPTRTDVCDTSRGVHECVVQMMGYWKGEEGKHCVEIFDVLDLTTGELQNLLSGFDSAYFVGAYHSRRFVKCEENGSIVFECNGKYGMFDVESKTYIEDYAYAEKKGPIIQKAEDGYQIRDSCTGERYFFQLPQGRTIPPEWWLMSPDYRKMLYSENDA
jgi:hypothetical protein